MAKINLLPWRAERRKAREREFQTMLGGALLMGALAVGAAIFHWGGLHEDQAVRNQLLEREITALDAKIKEIDALQQTREQLLQRKRIIEQLQSSRTQMVHMFDELVRTLPDGVRLTSLKQSADSLEIGGMAQSNARVSAYMRNMEKAGWIRNPDLKIVEATTPDKSARYRFSLTANLRKSEDEKVEGQGADAETGDPGAAATASDGGVP
ncbi:MAG: PilN domain-containing protein [Xanthomonadales bacterium]|jgi:type IV pilus assembly protein PilN|nr:PilN domain-containing protein [Xanthomonadales bacterium]